MDSDRAHHKPSNESRDYALITPAKNEARFIEKTIQSVVSQTILPIKWIIVSDGSTDGTDEIVQKYVGVYPWLELIRLPEVEGRNFASKVHAFNLGYTRIQDQNYHVIGNIDADVSFEADYFSFLLAKFAANPRLGVCGTPFREGQFQYDYRYTSIDHVSGACQLFRRECFEMIGGYCPVRNGGIDLIAEIKARMYGWQTRSFPEKVFVHYRPARTGMHKGLAIPFNGGKKDYVLGAHPIWEIFRCVYQMKKGPKIVGGLLRFLGFYWSLLTRVEMSMPREMVDFRRKEQMCRLRLLFTRLLGS